MIKIKEEYRITMGDDWDEDFDEDWWKDIEHPNWGGPE